MSAQPDKWPIERIRSLAKADVQNLRRNALGLGNDIIVERCEQVLNTGTTRRSSLAKRVAMNIPESASAELAALFLELPPVVDVSNAQARLNRLANPVTSFSVLWRQYITCGLSSLERSDRDTPLGRFAAGDSALLDLQSVIDHGEDPKWVAAELVAAGLNRMRRKELVLSAREAFLAAKGHDDSLVNGRSGTGLDVFLDLASGRADDCDIATSERFSKTIDICKLFGIGHKQMRNILVNTGLAHNVLPIDSRWKDYVGNRVHFEQADLGQRNRYLQVEDSIRRGLMLAQQQRNDIPNLAVLDSIVFAVKSREGHADGGWTGS